MKIAHILIPDFAIQVELLTQPHLRQTPIIIGGLPHEDGSVFACSPASRRDGVYVGMSLRQAEQLSPQATFFGLSLEKYDQAYKSLLEHLSPFSPFRESLGLGKLYLDAAGLGSLYGSDEELAERMCTTIQSESQLIPRIGIASNKFTAATAARLAELGTGQVVPPSTEARYLAPLPTILLPASDDTRRLFRRLGIETIGQVAEMPVGALSRTFGREGLLLHTLASGEDTRPLLPQIDAAPLTAEVHLDFPLERRGQLEAYADRLVTQLSAELQSSGLVAGALMLEVEQERGKPLSAGAYLRPASSDPRLILDRAIGLLWPQEFNSGATDLKIGLFPLHPFHIEGKQLKLFRPRSFTYNNPIQRLVGSIQERFGASAILHAADVEGPPPEAIVTRANADAEPTAFFRNDTWSRVASIELHWRLEGDWWWGEGRKDYFKVVTRKGEILVLFHDSGDRRWYVHSGAQPTTWPAI